MVQVELGTHGNTEKQDFSLSWTGTVTRGDLLGLSRKTRGGRRRWSSTLYEIRKTSTTSGFSAQMASDGVFEAECHFLVLFRHLGQFVVQILHRTTKISVKFFWTSKIYCWFKGIGTSSFIQMQWYCIRVSETASCPRIQPLCSWQRSWAFADQFLSFVTIPQLQLHWRMRLELTLLDPLIHG